MNTQSYFWRSAVWMAAVMLGCFLVSSIGVTSAILGQNSNSSAVAPSQRKPAKKTVVQGGILNGKAVSLPEPVYPGGATLREPASVVVQVTVSEKGNVIRAAATAGPPRFRAPAVVAARKAKFSPTLLSGEPVKVVGTLLYTFRPAGETPASAAEGPKPKATVISGGVLNGKAISLPKPVYPPVAKAAHASGAVTVQITIDEEGNVIDAKSIGGHPMLRAAAVAAARQAKFSTTKLGGVPVKVTGTLIYNFVLPADEPADSGAPVAQGTEAEPETVVAPAPVVGTRDGDLKGVLNSKAIIMVRPVYPTVARAAHASGQVEVQVLIETDGSIIEAKSISGHPLLRAAAVDAARQTKFEPTKLEGRPVRVAGIIVYNFQ